MANLVFASYAKLNRDEYLKRFIKDLEAEVKPLLKSDPGTAVVFFDERIESGEVARFSCRTIWWCASP